MKPPSWHTMRTDVKYHLKTTMVSEFIPYLWLLSQNLMIQNVFKIQFRVDIPHVPQLWTTMRKFGEARSTHCKILVQLFRKIQSSKDYFQIGLE
jgi:hypothetical protein